METHFQAKLTKIVVGRVKGIPSPVLALTLAPTYEPELTALSRDTGNAFGVRFHPLELDLFGVDVGHGPPELKTHLAKVNITPPKDDLGPTIQLSLVALYSADGVRLVARVGQRVAVTLEPIEDDAAVEASEEQPAADEQQTSFAEDAPSTEPADSEARPPAKPPVSPQDFFKRLADEAGEAEG